MLSVSTYNFRFCESMPQLATSVDLLRWRAQRQPEQRAYTFLNDDETREASLTYGELDRRARTIAVQLQTLEAEGSRVLLLYPSGLEYIAAFFGCLYAGAVAVPLYPPRHNQMFPRLRAIVSDAQPSIALTTRQVFSRVEPLLAEAPDLQALQWLPTDDLSLESTDSWSQPLISGETLAFLQYTSGSTNMPRGVMVSHANLLHNERMIQLAFQQTEQSVIVGWLPLYHDMGLIGNVLQPLYLGAQCILMSPAAFLHRPFRWLQAISRYRATTSGGPNFAYDLCVRHTTLEQRQTLDLSSWSVAFNGAEPVRYETLERFAEAFAPCGFRGEALYPCYGLAEATLFVSGGEKSVRPKVHLVTAASLELNQIQTASEEDKEKRVLVSCGKAWLGQRIVIVNPTSLTSCPPDKVGEIWLSGAGVTQGYWQRPDATEQTFRAYLSNTGEGPFLRTGDLGYLHEGELFVTGRLKDLIIIRGLNHYPHDLELTVERSHQSLRAGCGAAFSVEIDGEERLAVVQEVRRGQVADWQNVIELIRQAVAAEHEVQIAIVVLLKQGSVPKTSSGKIQRYACRQAYYRRSLKTVAEWHETSLDGKSAVAAEDDLLSPHDDIERWLVAQLSARLGLPAEQIDLNQPLTQYGLDSLAAVELMHKIETGLSITLQLSALLQSPSIAQIAGLARARTSRAAATLPSGIVSSEDKLREHPLSYGQQALWFLQQLTPESPAYNVTSTLRIRSALDVQAFGRALQKLSERHASLQTKFAASNGKPVQVIEPSKAVFLEIIDASDWNDDQLQDALVKESRLPFDLKLGPLLRVKLFGRSAEEHVVLLVAHHIVVDFWSLAVILSELGALYEAEKSGTRAQLASLTLQYTDYVRWQNEMLAGPEGERLRAYWQEKLAGELPNLNLPAARSRPPVQTFRGASHSFRLDAQLSDGLRDLSRRHHATLYMTLLAAFKVLLYRYTGQTDLVIGSPTAGRGRADFAPLVGYFVNPIVLRSSLSRSLTFEAFLSQVRQTVLEAFEHQDYPFALLVEHLQPERDLSRSPLFQTMFVLQKAPLSEQKNLVALALGEAGSKATLGDLELESVKLEQQVALFDNMLVMAETEEGISASLQYSTDLFDAATIEQFVTHFEMLLESIISHPEQKISAFKLLTAAEEQQLLVENNATEVEYREGCIHELFEEQVERTPERVAVVSAGQQVTYGELNRRANQLAHYLRGMGVGAESLVGICVERSVEMVVGLLGILKAGGAYVPLDPAYPQERLSYMVADAGVEVVVSEEKLKDVVGVGGAQVICLDREWAGIAGGSGRNPDAGVRAENLAYMIYTSGSTGKPKAVAIEHRNTMSLLHWAGGEFGAAELGGVLASTSLCFDLSVFELFVPLSWGGSGGGGGERDAVDDAGGGGAGDTGKHGAVGDE